MFLPTYIKSAVERTRKTIRRRIAALWQQAYRAQYMLGRWVVRYASIAFSTVLLLLVLASVYLSSTFQTALEAHYATAQAIEGLRGLILNMGSALIGAAAIVTSLVLFAMQVNIERMPHGLFRRLSGDLKLLGAFALAFLLAIGVATLSTFVDQVRLAHVVLEASWAVVFILISFMYAYRRALGLINPLRQLGILIHDTRKELRTGARRAQRAMPLLEREESASATSSPTDSTHDLARTAFFQINNRWTDGAKRAIRHAMSFARRYAEQGDYEVSGAALNAVVGINAAYIESKGKTFYANNPFVDNPLSSDSFFNDTLEHLRQNAQSGIVRRDEQQIEQTLQAMAALVQVYLSIDYEPISHEESCTACHGVPCRRGAGRCSSRHGRCAVGRATAYGTVCAICPRPWRSERYSGAQRKDCFDRVHRLRERGLPPRYDGRHEAACESDVRPPSLRESRHPFRGRGNPPRCGLGCEDVS